MRSAVKQISACDYDFGYDSTWINVGKRSAEDCEKVNIKGQNNFSISIKMCIFAL